MFVWSPSDTIKFAIVILIYWIEKLINTLLDPLEHENEKISPSTIKTNTLLFNSYYRRTDNMKVFASVLTLTAIMATTVLGQQCRNCNVWVLTILLNSAYYNCIINHCIGLPWWWSLLLCCQPRNWWYWLMCWAQLRLLQRWRGILRYCYLRLNGIMEWSWDNLLPLLRLCVENMTSFGKAATGLCLSGIHLWKVKQKTWI